MLNIMLYPILISIVVIVGVLLYLYYIKSSEQDIILDDYISKIYAGNNLTAHKYIETSKYITKGSSRMYLNIRVDKAKIFGEGLEKLFDQDKLKRDFKDERSTGYCIIVPEFKKQLYDYDGSYIKYIRAKKNKFILDRLKSISLIVSIICTIIAVIVSVITLNKFDKINKSVKNNTDNIDSIKSELNIVNSKFDSIVKLQYLNQDELNSDIDTNTKAPG